MGRLIESSKNKTKLNSHKIMTVLKTFIIIELKDYSLPPLEALITSKVSRRSEIKKNS